MPDDRDERDDVPAGSAEPDEPNDEEAAKIRRGRAFTVLRHCLGFQQQEVATRSGLTRGTVSDYERAQSAPEAANLELLFRDGLGLPLYALEDAEDFIDYVGSLHGRSGAWRDIQILRRGEVTERGADSRRPARLEHLRIAGAFGQAMARALLSFLESFESSASGSGPEGDERGS